MAQRQDHSNSNGNGNGNNNSLNADGRGRSGPGVLARYARFGAMSLAVLALSATPRVLPAQSPAPTAGGDRSGERISVTEALATFDSAWSRVRNAHYDPAMRGIDWSRVRDELRPRAERAATLGELRVVLTEMLARLGESHYGIIREETDDVLETSAGQAETAGEPGDAGLSLRLLGADVVVSHVVPGGRPIGREESWV